MDVNPDISEKRISELISDYAKLLASVTTFLVLASIAREYMYFWTIGFEFLQIYSISDYAKLTINWIPSALIAGSLGFLINYADLNARFDAAIKYGARGLEPWSKPDKLFKYTNICIIGIGLLTLPYITWSRIRIIELPLYILTLYFLGRQIENGRLPLTHRPAEGIIFYAFVAWLMSSAIFGGLSEGIKDLNRNETIYQIKFLDQEIDAVILRNIDKGLIYKSPNSSQIMFVNSGQLSQIKSSTKSISDKMLYQATTEWAVEAIRFFKGN